MKFSKLKEIVHTKDHPINFYRNISILITFCLTKTTVTPGFITGLWVVLGIIGGTIFWFIPQKYLPLAATMILLVPILDFVDGEIARYRNYIKQNSFPSSPKWNFWDWIGFWIIKYLIMGGLTYRMFIEKNNPIYLLIGFAMIFGYSMIEHIRMHERLEKHRRPTKIPSSQANPKAYKIYQIVRKIFLFEYFHLILFITVLINRLDIMLYFYSTVYSLHWIGKVIYENIRGFKD